MSHIVGWQRKRRESRFPAGCRDCVASAKVCGLGILWAILRPSLVRDVVFAPSPRLPLADPYPLPAFEVESDGRQGPLHCYVRQSTPLEPPHPSVFFQAAEHRFHQLLASPVLLPSGRAAQFLSHALDARVLHRSVANAFRLSQTVELPCQIRIRYVAVQPTLL